VLTPAEADHLFRILKQLKEQGKTVQHGLMLSRRRLEIINSWDIVTPGKITDKFSRVF
jgi:simple sugar transport system ATP-binding protein